MLSRHVTKIIQNLEKKKFRDKYNLFKIEGEKLVRELLTSRLKIHTIIAYPGWIELNKELLSGQNVVEADEQEMHSISNFQSLPDVIALAEVPEHSYDETLVRNTLSLVLNGIQDPGNLGTILRLSDWFGIKNIFCDSDCASIYNPKCVQASMGAIFRVNVFYTELLPLIQKFKTETFHCYGTFLDGENIYKTELDTKGFIVMGNEGRGISAEIGQTVDYRLTIPSFASNPGSTESLNVGVATGIMLSEFCRRR